MDEQCTCGESYAKHGDDLCRCKMPTADKANGGTEGRVFAETPRIETFGEKAGPIWRAANQRTKNHVQGCDCRDCLIVRTALSAIPARPVE